MMREDIEDLISKYRIQKKAFSGFMSNVVDFFEDNDNLYDARGRYCVHSVKSRLKDEDHLREKIYRKFDNGMSLDGFDLFKSITDLCGVRVMHLKRGGGGDFPFIHAAICSHVDGQHWMFGEELKAYTYDPEYNEFFDSLVIKSELKPSFYTSVHYLVKPNAESKVTCEIQVRSLFEEVWGEIDHDINYPNPTNNKSCSEQLKVLAKVAGAGLD